MIPLKVEIDEATSTAYVTFPVDGVVKINGIPVVLTHETTVRTHKNNVPLIDHPFMPTSGNNLTKEK